jgi:transposase
MSLPEWVAKHREPKTEIKCIKGIYYKYSVSYKYSPLKKRTDKISGILLGKITENGFIPSDKNSLRDTSLNTNISVKSAGLSAMFFELLKNEFSEFKKFFSPEIAEVLFAFSMVRWAYNAPIKRTPYYFNHDFCSEYFSVQSISEKTISNTLRRVGENRESVVKWKKSLLQETNKIKSEYIMMDSTHVSSFSGLLNMNSIGYNPEKNFDAQIRLMYVFSSELYRPIYYRAINGNITDVKSMKLCVEEMKLQNVIYIGDKGFYSKENINMMEKEDLQYIIPLYRNNSLIDFKPLNGENYKKKLDCFLYQKRIIWHYQYEKENKKIITFLDEKLRTKEESDYLDRIEKNIENYSKEKFIERLDKFGTLTMVYKTTDNKTPVEIYKAYKRRNEVEVAFDAYKNFLQADKMYMQNKYVMEGWLTANFIAMIAYYKLLKKLQEENLNNKYAPKDIIEISKSINKCKINGVWHTTEVTKKISDLFIKLNIDYLKLLQS